MARLRRGMIGGGPGSFIGDDFVIRGADRALHRRVMGIA